MAADRLWLGSRPQTKIQSPLSTTARWCQMRLILRITTIHFCRETSKMFQTKRLISIETSPQIQDPCRAIALRTRFAIHLGLALRAGRSACLVERSGHWQLTTHYSIGKDRQSFVQPYCRAFSKSLFLCLSCCGMRCATVSPASPGASLDILSCSPPSTITLPSRLLLCLLRRQRLLPVVLERSSLNIA